jgi:hypothetical protein
MHWPTLADDFSSHSTLAFAPFQSLLSRCAPCVAGKSRVLTLLRTLFLSLRSFRRPPRLFSIACGLFVQNTGGVGASVTSPLSAPACSCRRVSALSFAFFCHAFVFMALQIAFPATPFFCETSALPPGCGVRAPLRTLSIVFNSSHQLRRRGKFPFTASACYRPHLQGGLCPLAK